MLIFVKTCFSCYNENEIHVTKVMKLIYFHKTYLMCQIIKLISSQICVSKMSTRGGQGSDSLFRPLDSIPEERRARVQRTQSGFEPFDKHTSQVKRVHSENNACINASGSNTHAESPKLRRHSSPSSVSVSVFV